MLAVAGLFMAACGEEDNIFAGLKTANPEEGITIPGFSAVSAGAVDLGTFADDDPVTLFTLTDAALPEGYSVENVRVYIHPTDDATAVTKFECNGTFTKAELQQYVEGIYGKRPAPRSFVGKVYASVVDANGTGVLVDAGQVSFTITPEAPVISQNYYIVGGPLDWAGSAASKEQKFSHSDKDVYEDPVFTYVLNCTGETWFAIGDDAACDAIANDNNWSLLLGTTDGNGNNGMTGSLAPRSQLADDGSLKIAEAGTYLITLNMMDYTFTITPVAARFYMVGALPGWNADGALTALLFPQGNNVFTYTTKFTGAYDCKFWAEDDLDNWDNAYGCAVDGCADPSGALINSGAGAISAPSAEYYTFTFDLGAMQYSWVKLDNQAPTEYASMWIVGGFNDWPSDSGVEMTQVTPHNWYVQATIGADTELKFRANDNWDVNWGYGDSSGAWTITEADNAKVGTYGGGNLFINAGTYRFYLNDITGEISIITVKQPQ